MNQNSSTAGECAVARAGREGTGRGREERGKRRRREVEGQEGKEEKLLERGGGGEAGGRDPKHVTFTAQTDLSFQGAL